jgi:hypothetical protein
MKSIDPGRLPKPGGYRFCASQIFHQFFQTEHWLLSGNPPTFSVILMITNE